MTKCPKCNEGILKGGTGLFLHCPHCRSEFDLNMNYLRTTGTEEEIEEMKKFWLG